MAKPALVACREWMELRCHSARQRAAIVSARDINSTGSPLRAVSISAGGQPRAVRS